MVHVAVINGTNYKLYIDGISVQTEFLGNPYQNDAANCILELWIKVLEPINYFNGWMNFAFGKWN
jgi:hypothetical protein